MQSTVPTIYVLHGDQAFTAWLLKVVAPSHRTVRTPDWEELGAALRRCFPTSLAVVDPYFSGVEGRTLSPELRRLLSEFPSTPVLAALRVTPARAPDVCTLMEWGIAEIIDLGERVTATGLGRHLDRMRGYRMGRVLEGSLPRFTSARARTLLAIAGEVVAVGGLAPELAASLRITERTLLRWCRKLNLLPPRRLLAWLRLLLAGDMLCEGSRTVASVAWACGYVSDTSLRNALKLVAGTTPADVRDQGVGATLAARFGEELTKLREESFAGRHTPRLYVT